MKIEEIKTLYEEASDYWADNVKNYEDDVKFVDGEQWPESIVRERELSGRPCLTVNRMKTFIRQVVNDARQNKPAIRVSPVDEKADPDTAEVLNGLIRNIESTSNAAAVYDSVIEQSCSGGFAFLRVDLEYADDAFEVDLVVNRILDPCSVVPDMESESVDSSDWDYCFVSSEMDKKTFEKQYGDEAQVSWDDYKQSSDKWYRDGKIVICEYWTRELVPTTIFLLQRMLNGQLEEITAREENLDELFMEGWQVVNQRETTVSKVGQKIVTGSEILEENEWQGKYIPIVPVYGDESYLDGKRYFRSLIYQSKDAQRMFNYWRTTSTELVALAPKAPWVGPTGSFDSDERWETANTENHATLEYDGPVPPQRQPFAGIPAGALQEAMNASDDMKSTIGIFDAALGAQSNEVTGKAIVARQRESDNSTFHFIDNLSRAIRHTGLILLDMIPKVYGERRILRILGEDDTPQNIPMGQPTNLLPNGKQVDYSRIYDLSVGKYDLMVKAGPGYATKREESASQMIEFLRSFPAASPLIGDLVAKNLDWPGADDIAERLKAALPPHLQQADSAIAAVRAQMEMQLQQQQAAIQQGQAMIAGLQQQLADKSAEIQIDQTEAQIKAQEAQTKQYAAETDRLEAEVKAMAEQAKAAQMQIDAGKPVEMPQIDLTPILSRIEGLQMQMAQPQAPIVVGNQDQPKQKTTKAIKQPDGTYLIESVEYLDGYEKVKRARAGKDEAGNLVMNTIEVVE